jgi:hypothetical protein
MKKRGKGNSDNVADTKKFRRHGRAENYTRLRIVPQFKRCHSVFVFGAEFAASKSTLRRNGQMTRCQKKPHTIDLGRFESLQPEPSEEVKAEFAEASRLGGPGGEFLFNMRLREHHESSPVLSGVDLDAAWEDADVGEESVGGANPTPDQSIVDELGAGAGLMFNDNESLRSLDKVRERDRHRWELDPASSEDYAERNHR